MERLPTSLSVRNRTVSEAVNLKSRPAAGRDFFVFEEIYRTI